MMAVWIESIAVGRTGLTEAEILRKIESGNFPEPIGTDGRRLYWMALDVIGWMSRR